MFLMSLLCLEGWRSPRCSQAVLVQMAESDRCILDCPVRSLHKILEYLKMREENSKDGNYGA